MAKVYKGDITGSIVELSLQDEAAGGGGGGTVQGTDATYDIQAANEGTFAGGLRGENSVDLQTLRFQTASVASGLSSVLSGGSDNSASGNYSTVSGGYQNIASGARSTVSGGQINTASGADSVIGGGHNNNASTIYGVIGGGFTNTVSNNYGTVGGGTTNSVSGLYGTVVGGRNNTVTHRDATVLGGNNNTASGNYSTVSGRFAKSAHYAARVHSSGSFAFLGDSQTGSYMARNTTTDGTTATQLWLNGANQRLFLTPQLTMAYSIRIAAYNTTDNTSGTWFISGGIRRNDSGGGDTCVSIGQTVDHVFTEGTMSGCVVAVTADDTTKELKIEATGLASKTIKWTATIETTEMADGNR